MIPTINITAYRDNTRARDLAILDLLQLQQLGLAPGAAPVQLLRELWSLSQSQVSRRMAAVADLGVYQVRNDWGRYLINELRKERKIRRVDHRAMRERWEATQQAWQQSKEMA